MVEDDTSYSGRCEKVKGCTIKNNNAGY
ncbi:hypothetical protein NC652_028022 [Populus alba x Populus x berolinensis]|nr:hypothetical protein NC652_028022 [Populus alba x Populus x berolinensis]